METEKPKTEPADLLGTALPEPETNGDIEEIKKWWRWGKMTGRVTWRVIGGLFVLAVGCAGVFKAIEEFIKLLGMLSP
jgi:hypothetical protein